LQALDDGLDVIARLGERNALNRKRTMTTGSTDLEKAIADRLATLVQAGHDPEQVALAALDMACGVLSAARGPLWLAQQLEAIARGLVAMSENASKTVN
jgi:hypothetical protein